jgi:tetratricopeptide (TPR) repeat protein
MLAYERDGDKAMKEGEYELALENYQIARKFFKVPLRLFYKSAEACRLSNNYNKAEYYYQKVITENDTANLSIEFPLLFLNFAEVSLSNGNLFTAQKLLSDILLDSISKPIHYIAQHKLNAIDWIIKNNRPVYGTNVNNVGKNINNESSQICHWVSSDTLMYLSNIDYNTHTTKGITYYEDAYQQLYTSKIDSNSYSLAERLNIKEINKKKNNISNICFDPKTKTAYFTRCTSFDNNLCFIYYSELKDGKYTKAKKLNNKINLKGSNNTHPNIGIVNNESVLFFSSNRKGGYGGYDLYYYILNQEKSKDNNNQDNQVVNLGNIINTQGDEITPFYSEKDLSLYFASDYHIGFGGFDIFVSKGSINKWDSVENLLQPINSIANDHHPIIVEPNEKGYFTSNREGSFAGVNKTCCYDIYDFNISGLPETPTMEEVKTKTAFSPVFDLPLQLFFHNDQPNPQSTSTTTKIDYQECYKEYKSMNNLYKAEATRYINDSTESIIIDSLDNFFQVHIDKGMNKLNHMCEYLYQKLIEGEKIDISIIGYSSSLHNNMYNYALSERRIGTIINYMNKWEEGKLKPFLSKSANDSLPYLHIKTLAMGKLESKSENPTNAVERRKSIYKIDAMYERRIEIRLIEVRK